MSSFNLNGPSNNMPQIREAQQMMNNGGGGNTGYLDARGQKNKKKKNEEFDPDILEGESEDKFERNTDSDDEEYDDYDDYYGQKPALEKDSTNNKSDTPKNNMKDMVFGFIEKVTRKNNVKKNPPDDSSGGDFLTLSGK